jgi:hypothetical protein
MRTPRPKREKPRMELSRAMGEDRLGVTRSDVEYNPL